MCERDFDLLGRGGVKVRRVKSIGKCKYEEVYEMRDDAFLPLACKLAFWFIIGI